MEKEQAANNTCVLKECCRYDIFELDWGLLPPIRHSIITTDNTQTVFFQYVHIALDASTSHKVWDVYSMLSEFVLEKF
jgi:hypothetical protein